MSPGIDAADEVSQLLATTQAVCGEERATVFTSTYCSTPLAAPVIMMVHDMIPGVLGMDLNEPGWREKAHCVSRAARFVAAVLRDVS